MELIDIIYKVLIYGGVLLSIVILISYLFARLRHNESKSLDGKKVRTLNDQTIDQKNFQIQRQTQIPPLIIHHLDQAKVREVKVVRKPTVSREEQERDFYSYERKKGENNNGNGSRYTIVNEDMQRTSKTNAVNFYLY